MNPENLQKPNFERIELKFKKGLSRPIYASPTKKEKSDWIKTWEAITTGKISYPDNPKLEDLLKEYNLEAFLPDFKFMGFIWTEQAKKEKEFKEQEIIDNNIELEFLRALKFLKENTKIQIRINSAKDNKGITINSPDLIDEIFQNLFESYKKYENLNPDGYFKYGSSPFEYGIDWWKHIDIYFQRAKSLASQRGRRIESLIIYKIVYLLQDYLQENTEIKAEAGARYSNEQARFIFSFLEIHGLIENPELIAKKEDTIQHYLTYLRKGRKSKQQN